MCVCALRLFVGLFGTRAKHAARSSLAPSPACATFSCRCVSGEWLSKVRGMVCTTNDINHLRVAARSNRGIGCVHMAVDQEICRPHALEELPRCTVATEPLPRGVIPEPNQSCAPRKTDSSVGGRCVRRDAWLIHSHVVGWWACGIWQNHCVFT